MVEFRGREQSLAELRSWAEGPDDLAGMLLVGPGGQGKTRLALKLCEQLGAEGWVAGLVRSEWDSRSASWLSESRFPVLAVVDYAETRIKQVRELIQAITDPSERVRVLLLARSAGEWRQQLPSELRYQLASPVVLPALEDTAEGRREAYRDAVRDLAPALAQLPGRANVDWRARARRLPPPDLSPDAYATILTIELQALADLLAAEDSELGESDDHRPGPPRGPRPGGAARSTDPKDLEDVLLDHEQLYWEQTAAGEGFVKPDYQPITLKRIVASATICGAADEDEAIRTVARVPGLGDKTSDACRGVARWLSELYPARTGRYWGSLQPDRVGEHLIGQVTRDKPDLLSTVLNGAAEQQQSLALTVVSRAAAHQLHLDRILRELLTSRLSTLGPLAIPVAIGAAHPEPVLDALRQAVLDAPDPEQLHPVHDVLPRQSLLLGSLAVDVTTRLVTLYRPLAEATPDAFLPALAGSLNNQSSCLSGLGRREQALAAIEEAVEIYRGLATARPDAFLPALAGSLNNQSSCLSDLGRREQALAAVEEAVEIRRGLATARPDAFLPDLAMSLNNQGIRLSNLERWEEALAIDEEAAGVYSSLAAAHPEPFTFSYADSLSNLAIDLSTLGQSANAVAASEKAVRIVAPLLERAPSLLADAGLSFVQRYVTLCDEAGQEADEKLLQRMYDVLVSADVVNPDDEAQ